MNYCSNTTGHIGSNTERYNIIMCPIKIVRHLMETLPIGTV